MDCNTQESTQSVDTSKLSLGQKSKRNLYLKVKLKTLAAEAKYIRKEERKLYGLDPRRERLYQHRIRTVRKEARATHLAYRYLLGASYQTTEIPRKTASDYDKSYMVNAVGVPLDVDNVLRMINKYGEEEVVKKDLQAWLLGGHR